VGDQENKVEIMKVQFRYNSGGLAYALRSSMSDLERIILSAIATIIGGVIVYFLGHLSVALFVEPIHRLRSVIGEIADSLVFYANVYCNPGLAPQDKNDEASEVLRRQASQLKSRAYAIPWYPLWQRVKVVRKKKEIEEASAELIALSNSIHGGAGISGGDNSERRERVEKLLGIAKGK